MLDEILFVQCVNCKSSDQLYKDVHGTFCSRCGPSYPVEPQAITNMGHVLEGKQNAG